MKKTQSLSRMTALILMFALLLTGMFPASAFANEDQPFVGKRVLSAEVDGVFYTMEELEAMGITWGEAESEAPQMMSRMAPMAAGDSHYIRQTQVLGALQRQLLGRRG